jgi:hypothetical protein
MSPLNYSLNSALYRNMASQSSCDGDAPNNCLTTNASSSSNTRLYHTEHEQIIWEKFVIIKHQAPMDMKLHVSVCCDTITVSLDIRILRVLNVDWAIKQKILAFS